MRAIDGARLIHWLQTVPTTKHFYSTPPEELMETYNQQAYQGDYKYIVSVSGGLGPDAWDREFEIKAPNHLIASHIAAERARAMDAIVNRVEQVE